MAGFIVGSISALIWRPFRDGLVHFLVQMPLETLSVPSKTSSCLDLHLLSHLIDGGLHHTAVVDVVGVTLGTDPGLNCM